MTEVLALLYLHGLSSGDFLPALEEFFGSKAGLSASVVTRLTTTAWQNEQRRFAERGLSAVDYVYLWVDGVRFTVRLDEDRCAPWAPRTRSSRTFATVRLRTKVTKGPGGRAAGLAMVFKLLQAAEEHWRYLNGAHLVALVRAGAKLEKGVLVERPEQAAKEVAA